MRIFDTSGRDMSYYKSLSLSLLRFYLTHKKQEKVTMRSRFLFVREESRLSLKGPYGSPSGDSVQPFPRISNKVIDAVTESVANGKANPLLFHY